ncbi:hypothetical protein SDC9_137911 [bioreactor metagenome]|uniref:Uncharacterized protein n=1 Tax=bioreactor metagenome TaxID=1076179 RepID=A0A645DND7_9ZZZZ
MSVPDYIFEDFLKVDIRELVRIAMIVVYEKPKDYPQNYIARLWDGNIPTHYAVIRNSLEDIRLAIPPMHRISRHPDDDPVIVETWI